MGERFAITLPVDLAERRHERAAAEGYAAADELIEDTLLATLGPMSDAATERWLHEVVVPTLECMDEEPARARDPKVVRTALRAALEEPSEAAARR